MTRTPKVVFLSYSHDSTEHVEKVLRLSECLRQSGFDTRLDQYVNGSPDKGWPRWMHDELEAADLVLLICTETYYRRFWRHEEQGTGVDWEWGIISQELYAALSRTTRFIPILFQESDARFIPDPLAGHTHYVLTSEEGFQDLCDALLDQKGVEPGPIGVPELRSRLKAEPLDFGAGARSRARTRLQRTTEQLLGREMKPERQKRIEVDLDPAPAPDAERRPEVFISYAWGDDSPEGIRRTPVVDRLQEELEKSGFAVHRDRDAQRPGDLISQFMKRLTEADHVVVVISEKYLHSFDCMYEIYRIYQGSRADGEGFAHRVVPVVLPEVRLRRFEQRKPYLQFWSASAKELEASIRDPDIAPSKASWDEVRLIREFAQSVDEILCFVSDVLIPKNLDVLLGSDFEAVKAALLRRLKA